MTTIRAVPAFLLPLYCSMIQRNMTTRSILYLVRSILVLGLGLFTCIFGYDCIKTFGVFFFPCFIGTMAINLCLLFGIQFFPRKREETIALVYLILFGLSFYYLSFLTAIGLFNFHADAERWFVTRIWVSVLFTDYCVIWLAIRCLLFLRSGRSRLLKDSPLEEGNTVTT